MTTGPISFLAIFFGTLLLGLWTVASFNHWVGISGIFKTGLYERRLVEALREGYNVAPKHSPRGFDDRLVQQFLIEQMSEAPEVIVLGSSRTMQIRAKHFP